MGSDVLCHLVRTMLLLSRFIISSYLCLQLFSQGLYISNRDIEKDVAQQARFAEVVTHAAILNRAATGASADPAKVPAAKPTTAAAAAAATTTVKPAKKKSTAAATDKKTTAAVAATGKKSTAAKSTKKTTGSDATTVPPKGCTYDGSSYSSNEIIEYFVMGKCKSRNCHYKKCVSGAVTEAKVPWKCCKPCKADKTSADCMAKCK